MKYSELIASCQGHDTIHLVVKRRWTTQRRIKLLPGGKVTGVPVARLSGGATLVEFKAADVVSELAPFAQLDQFVEALNLTEQGGQA